MNAKLARVLADLQQRLRGLYGERLVRLVLFGSEARGDAEPGSDIDVMVVLRGTVDPGEEIERAGSVTAELSLRNDVVISSVYISEESFTNEQSPLLLNVRREGVLL